MGKGASLTDRPELRLGHFLPTYCITLFVWAMGGAVFSEWLPFVHSNVLRSALLPLCRTEA